MKKTLIIIIAVLLLGVGYLVLFKQTPPTPQKNETKIQEGSMEEKFTIPKKSAHYESNTPAHGVILAAVPLNVVIDFNFDLVKPSSITIDKDSKDYGVGETVIDKNKLTMRRTMNPDSPEGRYTVLYRACWPDKTCHDGNFQFEIDKRKSKTYEDQRGKNEVTVKLADIAFKPKNLLISRGTKITWINDDGVEHYINTDSHPAHTYYLSQNSEALNQDGSYSLAFNTPGIYPYHCSAHADSMSGSIIVE